MYNETKQLFELLKHETDNATALQQLAISIPIIKCCLKKLQNDLKNMLVK